MNNMVNGCLLINKEKGLTSRQEVNKISKILKTKKVGHIGTLDPFATGLLIVLVGNATKISPFLEKEDKTYAIIDSNDGTIAYSNKCLNGINETLKLNVDYIVLNSFNINME